MIYAEAKRGEKESLRKYVGRLTGLTGKEYKSAYDRARYAARTANATIGTKYTAADILQEQAKVQKFGYSSKTLEAVYLTSKSRGGTAENRGRLGDFSALAEVAQYGVVAAVVKISRVTFPAEVFLVCDSFECLIGRFD